MTAVTLTCKQGQMLGGVYIKSDLIILDQNLRHFLNKLRKRAKVKKRHKFLVFPVTEGLNGRYHHHLAISRPTWLDENTFKTMIAEVWHGTLWGAEQVVVEHGADTGWIAYLCKLRSKSDFADSIDWGNAASGINRY